MEKVRCKYCNGTGYTPVGTSHEGTCIICDGTGKMDESYLNK